MKELSKSIPRRMGDSNFLRRYFVGRGVDIGGKPDPLALYSEFFPLLTDVRVWDLEDGDAQFMEGVEDNTFDFVHSSHCLEHLNDPAEGLRNWLRVVKPGGYIVALVPDEDLYEQGVFPSTYNLDHKQTFTVFKNHSWSGRSINLLSLLAELGPEARVEKIELLTASYRFNLPRFDQTSTPVGECAIEFVIRKATDAEVRLGGREQSQEQPPEDLRIHYNQYRDDYQQMKKNNSGSPPFTNTAPL
jgi:SAM-dependent methyltransferase